MSKRSEIGSTSIPGTPLQLSHSIRGSVKSALAPAVLSTTEGVGLKPFLTALASWSAWNEGDSVGLTFMVSFKQEELESLAKRCGGLGTGDLGELELKSTIPFSALLTT